MVTDKWRTVSITKNRFSNKVWWILFIAIFFNTQKCVNKKNRQKSFSSHKSWEKNYRNNLFSLLHDASLKAAVFSGCTFWRFHIFRFWNYPIKWNLHFSLKKCGNTTQRKGRRICPYRSCSICSGGCSISNLPCKDIKYLTKCQVIWPLFLAYNPNKPVHRR